MIIDRGDFWEFKARTTELDLEAVRLRSKLAAIQAEQHRLLEAFCAKHDFDPARPLMLEDTDCSVWQQDEGERG